MGTTTANNISQTIATRALASVGVPSQSPVVHLLTIFALWSAIFATALIGPPLLDDADATHAQAAQAMLDTGDWATLHVDGIRYLEKPPLPYWITAASLHIFPHQRAFAVHLPLALTILGLAILGYAWSRRAFNSAAAFYTAIFTLTSTGVFLFTRIFIPDALLSLLLAISLYTLLRSIEAPSRFFPYAMWTSLALAVLTKGLIAPIFILGAAFIFMASTGQQVYWRSLRPFTGILLFLAIAAPWHILAGLRNTGGENGRGFFWFYFVNEHFLRFLGRRIPRDYNKLPTALYWSLHLVWLFPWSLFTPAATLIAYRARREKQLSRDLDSTGQRLSRFELIAHEKAKRTNSSYRAVNAGDSSLASNTVFLLLIFSALVLVFFSLSTNQEYYTFPVYLPLLMLLAAALSSPTQDRTIRRALTFSFASFFILGLAISAALIYGLWTARHMPFIPDIGSLLAHRNVGDYTLSMSHFFDLTGTSFAALRLPATLAAIAFTVGPGIAWLLHARRKPSAAILTIALTSTVFLIAAHLALLRFAPMLSSANFASTIQTIDPRQTSKVLLYGDQAYGSSIPFYLDRRVDLVDGRTTSMLFGSSFHDAPPIFLTHDQLLAQWGKGPRKILFVPLDLRAEVDTLLGTHKILIQETSGKALFTDRPLP
jgi:4-amino-4-deoxy-L-arabinose transferase-like glycosyltransferase